MKRSLSYFASVFGIHGTEPVLQVTNYKRKSDFGFPLLILQQITISRADTTTMEPLHGSPRVLSLRNGRRGVPSCGYTANVRVHLTPNIMSSLWSGAWLDSGCWEECPMVSDAPFSFVQRIQTARPAPALFNTSRAFVIWDRP